MPIPTSQRAVKFEPQPPAQILKKVPRPTPQQIDAKKRALAGIYRVIHGRVIIPRPVETFTRADGSEIPHAPKFDEAEEGDEIKVGDEDAARLMDAGVIEKLDARPSRVGKVFDPEEPHMTPRVKINANSWAR